MHSVICIATQIIKYKSWPISDSHMFRRLSGMPKEIGVWYWSWLALCDLYVICIVLIEFVDWYIECRNVHCVSNINPLWLFKVFFSIQKFPFIQVRFKMSFTALHSDCGFKSPSALYFRYKHSYVNSCTEGTVRCPRCQSQMQNWQVNRA